MARKTQPKWEVRGKVYLGKRLISEKIISSVVYNSEGDLEAAEKELKAELEEWVFEQVKQKDLKKVRIKVESEIT